MKRRPLQNTDEMLDTKTKTNATVKFTDSNTQHRGYGVKRRFQQYFTSRILLQHYLSKIQHLSTASNKNLAGFIRV